MTSTGFRFGMTYQILLPVATVPVMTPSAKADGFLGHARTIMPRYVPSAQSERTGINITGGVDISINDQPAVRARVNTISKSFGNIRLAPASGAYL